MFELQVHQLKQTYRVFKYYSKMELVYTLGASAHANARIVPLVRQISMFFYHILSSLLWNLI